MDELTINQTIAPDDSWVEPEKALVIVVYRATKLAEGINEAIVRFSLNGFACVTQKSMKIGKELVWNEEFEMPEPPEMPEVSVLRFQLWQTRWQICQWELPIHSSKLVNGLAVPFLLSNRRAELYITVGSKGFGLSNLQKLQWECDMSYDTIMVSEHCDRQWMFWRQLSLVGPTVVPGRIHSMFIAEQGRRHWLDQLQTSMRLCIWKAWIVALSSCLEEPLKHMYMRKAHVSMALLYEHIEVSSRRWIIMMEADDYYQLHFYLAFIYIAQEESRLRNAIIKNWKNGLPKSTEEWIAKSIQQTPKMPPYFSQMPKLEAMSEADYKSMYDPRMAYYMPHMMYGQYPPSMFMPKPKLKPVEKSKPKVIRELGSNPNSDTNSSDEPPNSPFMLHIMWQNRAMQKIAQEAVNNPPLPIGLMKQRRHFSAGPAVRSVAKRMPLHAPIRAYNNTNPPNSPFLSHRPADSNLTNGPEIEAAQARRNRTPELTINPTPDLQMEDKNHPLSPQETADLWGDFKSPLPAAVQTRGGLLSSQHPAINRFRNRMPPRVVPTTSSTSNGTMAFNSPFFPPNSAPWSNPSQTSPMLYDPSLYPPYMDPYQPSFNSIPNTSMDPEETINMSQWEKLFASSSLPSVSFNDPGSPWSHSPRKNLFEELATVNTLNSRV